MYVYHLIFSCCWTELLFALKLDYLSHSSSSTPSHYHLTYDVLAAVSQLIPTNCTDPAIPAQLYKVPIPLACPITETVTTRQSIQHRYRPALLIELTVTSPSSRRHPALFTDFTVPFSQSRSIGYTLTHTNVRTHTRARTHIVDTLHILRNGPPPLPSLLRLPQCASTLLPLNLHQMG